MMVSLPAARDARKKQDKEFDMVFNKQKDEQEFIVRVCHLTPECFIALAKLLGVKMSDVDK